jgi:hypothetical protein
VQRRQHQAEADQDAPEVVPGLAAAPPQDHPGQHQDRRQHRHVERQRLHHQAGAYVGAQHDGQRRRQLHQAARRKRRQHQSRGRRTLQRHGHRRTGPERPQAVAQRAGQEVPQLRSEGALNAGLHHVHAPHQEGGEAGQLEDDQTRVDGVGPPSPNRASGDATGRVASPARRREACRGEGQSRGHGFDDPCGVFAAR